MTFQEQIITDISTLLNSDEFGSVHNINGEDYTIIVDNDYLREKQVKGVYLGDILFFIATSDLEAILTLDANNYDQNITYDSDTYRVVSIEHDLGMSTVILSSDLNSHIVIVKYRDRIGTDANPDFGIPGTKTDWSLADTITPTPIFEEIKNDFELENIGIITTNDVKISVQKALFNRAQLQSYEYQLNGSVYDIIGGQVIEDAYFWNLYLRKTA